MLSYPRFFGTIKPELMRGSDADLGVLLDARMRAVWPRKLECPLGGRLLAISRTRMTKSLDAADCSHCIPARRRSASSVCSMGMAVANCPKDLGGTMRVIARDSSRHGVASWMRRRRICRRRMCCASGFPIATARRVPRKFAGSGVAPILASGRGTAAVVSRQASASSSDQPASGGRGRWPVLHGARVRGLGLLPPNAVVDISGVLDRKLSMVRHYVSQLRTVDYAGYVSGLARARAFHHPVNDLRTGAVEAYLALPVADYCELVRRAPPPAVT